MGVRASKTDKKT